MRNLVSVQFIFKKLLSTFIILLNYFSIGNKEAIYLISTYFYHFAQFLFHWKQKSHLFNVNYSGSNATIKTEWSSTPIQISDSVHATRQHLDESNAYSFPIIKYYPIMQLQNLQEPLIMFHWIP